MSNCVPLHAQVASIMEVLANAAVAEICKLVDDGYAVLRLEMAQSLKENETLKMKLEMMEVRTARENADRTRRRASFVNRSYDGAGVSNVFRVTETNAAFEDHFGVRGGEPAVLDEETSMPSVVTSDESQEERTTSLLIKEESVEEDFRTSCFRGSQKVIRKGTVVEDRSPNVTQEAPPVKGGAEHGGRNSARDVGGLEAVLKAESAKENVQDVLRNAKCEYSSVRQSAHAVCRAPEFLPRSPVTEPDDALGSYMAEVDPGSPPVHSGLPAVHSGLPAVHSGLPPVHSGLPHAPDPRGGEDTKPKVLLSPSGAVATEATIHPELTEETAPVLVHAQHRHYQDGTESRVSQLENVAGLVGGKEANSSASEVNVWTSCGISFVPSESVSTSSKFAANEKRYICKYCGKGFTRQNALEIHERVHTGEKPFRCAQCGKRFSDSSNHRRHQSVHSRERPFRCTQCERSFSYQHQLKVHQRVHTDSRPFSCIFCGKRFGEKNYLKIHQQRAHTGLYSLDDFHQLG